MKAILKGIPDFVNTPEGLRVGQEVKILMNPVKVNSLSDDDYVFISNGEWAINIPKRHLDILDDDEGIPGPVPEPKKRPMSGVTMKRVLLECVVEGFGSFTKGEVYQALLNDDEYIFLNDEGVRNIVTTEYAVQVFKILEEKDKDEEDLRRECLDKAAGFMFKKGVGYGGSIELADSWFNYIKYGTIPKL